MRILKGHEGKRGWNTVHSTYWIGHTTRRSQSSRLCFGIAGWQWLEFCLQGIGDGGKNCFDGKNYIDCLVVLAIQGTGRTDGLWLFLVAIRTLFNDCRASTFLNIKRKYLCFFSCLWLCWLLSNRLTTKCQMHRRAWSIALESFLVRSWLSTLQILSLLAWVCYAFILALHCTSYSLRWIRSFGRLCRDEALARLSSLWR